MVGPPTRKAEAEPRICGRTGLSLVPADGTSIWRVAKTSYGPLNPEQRTATGDRGLWGRYDVPLHRTVYGALPVEAAYGESLAWARAKFSIDGPQMRDLFDDVDAQDTTSLREVVEQEWAGIGFGHMPPGAVPAGWRQERALHELELPSSGWFVDIEAAASVAAVGKSLRAALAALGVRALTVGHLRSEERRVTTTIADWVWHQVLDDGSLPHGVRFGSKHGSDWHCWAIWLRAVDDGRGLESEPVSDRGGSAIGPPDQNEALNRIGELFHLKIT